MVAWKIGPALATGNTTVLKVRSSLRLTGSFSSRFTFNNLPAFGDHAPDCTQTRRPYQRSWFPARCRQHRKRLWYKHSLHYNSDQFLLMMSSVFLIKGTPLGKLSANTHLLRRSPLLEAPSLVAKF